MSAKPSTDLIRNTPARTARAGVAPTAWAQRLGHSYTSNGGQ